MKIKVLVIFHDGNVMEEYVNSEEELDEFLASLMVEFLNGTIESVELEEAEGEEEWSS